jgi:homoserine kinase type II
MNLDPVLTAYPPEYARRVWLPVGGGFSGAGVWKGLAPDGSAVALKQWPAGVPVERMRTIHARVAAASHLPFVSQVIPTKTGDTVFEFEERLWDMSAWMPGVPDSHPTDTRLSAACAAIAELHKVWFSSPLGAEGSGVRVGTRGNEIIRPTTSDSLSPCGGRLGWGADPTTHANPPPQGLREQILPAVLRRLALFRSYREWRAGGGRPTDTGHDGLNAAFEEAFHLMPAVLPGVEELLRPWHDRPLPTFPCLCDVHTGHVLFTGDRVGGIIDYGAMKVDHPAVDLARYLGGAANGDVRKVRLGVAAYRAAGPPVDVPEELAHVLDRTGAAGGLANWLLRLSAGQPVADPKTVAKRMGRLIDRLRLAADAGSH